MKKWVVKFWTPGALPEDDGMTFGSAVHGFCTPTRWVDPGASEIAAWEQTLSGEVLGGTYLRVLDDLKGIGFRPSAVIAFFSKNNGVEGFIDSCRAVLVQTPMVGGVAALGQGQKAGELLPKAEEVVLLLLEEDKYDIKTMNVHDSKGIQVEIRKDGERVIKKIRVHPGNEWVNALDFYSSRRESENIPADDFECLTFSDLAGVNVHCSSIEGGLKTGANLPENDTMVLRGTDADRVTTRLQEWVAAKDTLVFCCAGLRKLIRMPLKTGYGTLAGFMFGELVTIDKTPMFGNLMAARLQRSAVE